MGMIYFYNKQQGGTIRTTITTGGTTTPFFELGKHTKQDLINMLDQYPNAHAVELKGERVLITPVLHVLRNICWVLIQILYNS